MIIQMASESSVWRCHELQPQIRGYDPANHNQGGRGKALPGALRGLAAK